MNDVNVQATEIRELSAEDLAVVAGGRNMISLGPIRVQWWDDGAFEIGIRGVGSLLFADGQVDACPAQSGPCTRL